MSDTTNSTSTARSFTITLTLTHTTAKQFKASLVKLGDLTFTEALALLQNAVEDLEHDPRAVAEQEA